MSNNRELSEFADYLTVDDTTKNVGIGTTLKISAGGIFVGNTEIVRPDGTWGGPDTGLVGAQGAQGAQGFQGAVGAQGAQGAVGAQGAQGAQGYQGAAGSATITNNADDRVITGGSGSNLNGEANLTFNGSSLRINTTTSNAKLEVNNSSSSINIATIKTTAGAGSVAGLGFMVGQTTAGREKAALYFQETNGDAHYTGDLVFALNNDSGSAVQVSTSDERMRITSSGRALLGHTSNINNHLQQITTSNGATLGLLNYQATDDGPEVTFIKSRNGTKGSHTVVNNGDYLGRIFFRGSDGDSYERGVEIAAQVDGTPGNGDMPGRLIIYTTADGASVPTERLRIASTGAFGLSGANYGTSGQVLTSQGSGSAPQWATPAGSTWTWDTTQTTLAGNTSVTITGIPSSAVQVLVSFYNLSNNTNQDWIFRLGTSGGVATSGYQVSTGYMFTGSTNRTNGFHTYATGTASHKWTGSFWCIKTAGNLWYVHGWYNAENDANLHYATGKVSLTAAFDRINFSTYSGTFDDGGVYVHYMEP